MKFAFRMGNGSIFRNIYKLVAIVVVCSTLLNMLMIYYVRNRLLNDKIKEQDSYIDSYASAMDDVFLNISNILVYLQSNSDINNWNMPDYQKWEGYLLNEQNIFTLLRTFSYTNQAVGDIFVLSELNENIYTTRGVVKADTYYNNRYQGNYEKWHNLIRSRYNRITVKKIDDTIIERQPTGLIETSNSNIYVLRSIKSGSRYLGTGCVLLEPAFLENLTHAQGRQIFLIGEDNQILAGNNNANPQQLLSRMKERKIHNNSEFVSFVGLFSHRSSILNDVEYIIFTPYEQVAGVFDRFFLLTNLLSLLIMAALLCYAYLMSQDMYRPFRNIVNVLRDDSIKMNRNVSDETEFITSRILDILSENTVLQRNMQGSSKFVLQSVLYKVIIGSPSIEETLATSNHYNVSLREGYYGTLVIRMDLSSESDEVFYTEYYDQFKHIIDTFLERWMVQIIETKPDEYTIVFCCLDEKEYAEVLTAVDEAASEWCRLIPNSVFYIGCSDLADEIHQLRNCYKQSVIALCNRPVQDNQFIARTHGDIKNIPFLPEDLEIELLNMLKSSNYSYLHNYVMEILDVNYSANVSTEAYLSACYVINSYIGRYVRSRDETVFKDMIVIDMNHYFYSPLRAREVVLSNLSIVCSQFKEDRTSTLTVVDKVKDYVEKHFRENINLSSVAEELGYTPNHISRYFKQNKGINFTDYINRMRVEYAKSRLTASKNTLKQIAEESGFSNVNQFIRAFGKYEGTTPGEYRKSIMQKRL